MYDIVFFLSPEAVAAGAKVRFVAGKYVIEKAPQTTIQAVNGGRPAKDQTAEIAALQQKLSDARAGVRGILDLLN